MPYEWIPYALSAVASAAGSAFQNSGSASSQKRAFGYQQRLMYEQALLNQQMANNMFQAENEYNHPVAMMSRELKAGMNPYAIAQQLGAGRSVPADGAAASASQGSSPVGAPYQAPFNNMSADIANVGTAIKAIADAKKANIDTTAAEENLQTYLDQQKEQLKSTKLSNTHQELENDIFREFGRSKASYEVDKVAGEVMLTLAKEDESKWNQKLISEKINETIENSNYTRSEREQIERMLPWLEKEMAEKIENLRKQGVMYEKQGNAALFNAESGRISSVASAARDFAIAKTENEKRHWVVENAEYLAYQARDNWKAFAKSMQEEFALKYWQVEAIKANIDNMQKTRDLQEKQIYADIITSIISAGVKVGTAH